LATTAADQNRFYGKKKYIYANDRGMWATIHLETSWFRVYTLRVWTLNNFFFCGALPLFGDMSSPYRSLRSHSPGHTTLGRTPLDEWSARRTDLKLTTHDTQNRHSCTRRDSNSQSQQESGRRPTP
jgi:hypothetical protein